MLRPPVAAVPGHCEQKINNQHTLIQIFNVQWKEKGQEIYVAEFHLDDALIPALGKWNFIFFTNVYAKRT